MPSLELLPPHRLLQGFERPGVFCQINKRSPQWKGLQHYFPANYYFQRGTMWNQGIAGKEFPGGTGPSSILNLSVPALTTRSPQHGLGTYVNGSEWIQFGQPKPMPEFTLAAWCKPDVLGAGQNRYHHVMAKGGLLSTDSSWYMSVRSASNLVQVSCGFRNTSGTLIGLSYATGDTVASWIAAGAAPHHIVYAFGGTEHRMYLDGIQVSQATIGLEAPASNTHEARLGAGEAEYSTQLHWQGVFWDSRIYDYPVTDRLAKLIYDVKTRYELLQPEESKLFYFKASVGPPVYSINGDSSIVFDIAGSMGIDYTYTGDVPIAFIVQGGMEIAHAFIGDVPIKVTPDALEMSFAPSFQLGGDVPITFNFAADMQFETPGVEEIDGDVTIALTPAADLSFEGVLEAVIAAYGNMRATATLDSLRPRRVAPASIAAPIEVYVPEMPADRVRYWLQERYEQINEALAEHRLGIRAAPIELIYTVSTTMDFPLGISTIFYDAEFGVIEAVFCKCRDMVPGVTGGPVGFHIDSANAEWIITNDLAQSNIARTVGLLAAERVPLDDEYCWAIIRGANLHRCYIRAGETNDGTTLLGWSATNEVSQTVTPPFMLQVINAARDDTFGYNPGEVLVQ